MKTIKKQYVLLLTLFLTLFFACTNEIDYKGSAPAPRFIMNALLSADTADNKLYLNLSGNQGTPEVKNAIVNLYVNDVLKETLTYIPRDVNADYTTRTGHYSIKTPFAENDKIRIEATSFDGDMRVHAEVVVPRRVFIQKVDSLFILSPNSSDDYILGDMQLKIGLNDFQGETNYYRLEVKRSYITHGFLYWEERDTTLCNSSYGMQGYSDMALTDGKPISDTDMSNGLYPTIYNLYGIFNDSYFKDDSYTLNVKVAISDSEYSYPSVDEVKYTRSELSISVQSITEKQYDYLRIMNILDSDNYDPMMDQPIQIPSNVIGGLGFVGVHAGDKRKLIVSESFGEDNEEDK